MVCSTSHCVSSSRAPLPEVSSCKSSGTWYFVDALNNKCCPTHQIHFRGVHSRTDHHNHHLHARPARPSDESATTRRHHPLKIAQGPQDYRIWQIEPSKHPESASLTAISSLAWAVGSGQWAHNGSSHLLDGPRLSLSLCLALSCLLLEPSGASSFGARTRFASDSCPPSSRTCFRLVGNQSRLSTLDSPKP